MCPLNLDFSEDFAVATHILVQGPLYIRATPAGALEILCYRKSGRTAESTVVRFAPDAAGQLVHDLYRSVNAASPQSALVTECRHQIIDDNLDPRGYTSPCRIDEVNGQWLRLELGQQNLDLSRIDFFPEEPVRRLSDAKPVQHRGAHVLRITCQKRTLRNMGDGVLPDLESPGAALVVSGEDDTCMLIQVGQSGRPASGGEIVWAGHHPHLRFRQFSRGQRGIHQRPMADRQIQAFSD
jgi:hypothetical protein